MSLNDWMMIGGILVFVVGMLSIASRLIVWALDFDFFDSNVEDE